MSIKLIGLGNLFIIAYDSKFLSMIYSFEYQLSEN